MARYLHHSTGFLILTIFSFAATLAGAQGLDRDAFWSVAADGIWSDDNNWSSDVFPNNDSPLEGDRYDAFIDIAGTPYTVTLGEDVTVTSVEINSTDATLLLDAGTLATNVVNVVDGTFQIEGRVEDATVRGDGLVQVGSSFLQNSVLDNVTFEADVEHRPFLTTNVEGNLTLQDATWRVGGGASFTTRLNFTDATGRQTLGGIGTFQIPDEETSFSVSSDSELLIDEGISIEIGESDVEFVGSGVVNRGLVQVAQGGELALLTSQVVNDGVIQTAGELTIGDGADGSRWTNLGQILIQPNGSLQLQGEFSRDDLGVIVDQGAERVTIAGVFDNRNQVLNVDDLNLTVPLSFDDGQVLGGTITSSQGADALLLVNEGLRSATFDDVTLATDVRIGADGRSGTLDVLNRLTLDNVEVTLNGGSALFLTGPNGGSLAGVGTVRFTEDENISPVARLGSSVATIEEGITILNDSNSNRFFEASLQFDENRGTIVLDSPTAGFQIGRTPIRDESSFTNLGTIELREGVLSFDGGYTFEDVGNLQVEGGSVRFEGALRNEGSTILLDDNDADWTFESFVTGGTIQTRNGVIPNLGGLMEGVSLDGVGRITGGGFDQNLRVSESFDLVDGTLIVDRGAELGVIGATTLGGSGDILLAGSPDDTRIQTFNDSPLTIGAEVTVRTGRTGGGTVGRSNLTVVNEGTVAAEAQGESLVIAGDIENRGTLRADTATLVIEDESFENTGRIEVVGGGEVRIESDTVTNAAGGVIEGDGVIDPSSAELFNLGVIAPDDLTFRASVGLLEDSRVEIELGGTSLFDFDRIRVTENAILGGQLDLSLIDGFLPEAGDEFVFLEIDGLQFGQFFNLGQDSLVEQFGDTSLLINYNAGDGNDVGLIAVATAIPEPGCLFLLTCGGLSVICRRRRCL